MNLKTLQTKNQRLKQELSRLEEHKKTRDACIAGRLFII